MALLIVFVGLFIRVDMSYIPLSIVAWYVLFIPLSSIVKNKEISALDAYGILFSLVYAIPFHFLVFLQDGFTFLGYSLDFTFLGYKVDFTFTGFSLEFTGLMGYYPILGNVLAFLGLSLSVWIRTKYPKRLIEIFSS